MIKLSVSGILRAPFFLVYQVKVFWTNILPPGDMHISKYESYYYLKPNKVIQLMGYLQLSSNFYILGEMNCSQYNKLFSIALQIHMSRFLSSKRILFTEIEI